MKNSIFVFPFVYATIFAMTMMQSAWAEDSSDRVLRHAVFFSFGGDSSQEDIQGVVDAFAKLPSQIDAIIDFKHGKTIPGAKLSDGFTHAFLLTFKDEKGRETYLPHPAHKAFGDVLRPHMKDVFVVDYWGSKQLASDSETQPESELMHPVLFKFNASATPEEIKGIEEGFAQLATKVGTIKHFEWGKNNSPESHDDGFTHCFMVKFDGPKGLAEYLPHPAHQAFVKTIGPVEKIRVIDFIVE